MIKFKKCMAVSLSLLMILATLFVSPMSSLAVDTVNKTMVVGDTDTSASDMYDNYSKIVTITANSSNPSVASIVIDPSAAHSVTVTALSVGQATINVYANGNLAMVYNIKVTDGTGGGTETGGSLNGTFVLVHDKGDIGTFDSNGKLSYTASADDYVWVRNFDTGVQYCTDGWQGQVDTVTLINEKSTTKFDKLYVSRGTHTFTLIDNGNDTYTLTYGEVTPKPTTATEATTPVDNSKTKLQVLGDSIAVGYGLSSLSYGYPMLIANGKGYSLNNNAVNGHASYDLLDLLNNNSTVLNNVTMSDLVSISIGGNDLLQNMNNLLANINAYGPDCQYVNDIISTLESNLGKIITKIHQVNPNAVILLQTLYNPSEIRPIDGMNFSEPAKVIYPKLNAAYTNAANSYSKVYVADVFTAFANEFAQTHNSNLIQADGIHPSESGNQIIFNTLISKINELESAGILTPGNVVNPSTPVASQPTTGGQQGGNILNGKFVLVHDKGDIGFFDSKGTIEFTATEEDLVWVRNYDTGVQYCTNGWQGQVDTVTLINEKDVTVYFHKLYVTPGKHTFTLIDNGNDTYTLTYGEVEIPTQSETTPTPTYLYGDVNGDGIVNVKDATQIQKHSASIINLDSNQQKLGDVDGNNAVDVRDATLVQKYSAGIMNRFPCE